MRITSLRNRLALIIGLIVLTAIAIVYFAVVPQLEGRLRDQKLDGLADDAERYAPSLSRLVGSDTPQEQLTRQVGVIATRAGAEVNVLGVTSGDEESLFVLADSDRGGVEIDDVQSVAQTALATRRTARAYLTRAEALRRLGRDDDAMTAVEAAIKLNGTFAKAWEMKGRFLEGMRRYDEARTAYETFLDLQPTGTTSDKVRHRLAGMPD